MLSVNRVATIAACEEHLGSIELGTDGFPPFEEYRASVIARAPSTST